MVIFIQENLFDNVIIFIQENLSDNVICKIAIIFPQDEMC